MSDDPNSGEQQNPEGGGTQLDPNAPQPATPVGPGGTGDETGTEGDDNS